jgi:signal transduction histidine kinase
LNVVLVVAIALPVVWRRRAPVAALVAYWLPAQVWLDAVYGAHSNLPLEPFLTLLVLVYSAAAYAGPRGQRIVAVVLVALFASELALLAVGEKGWGNVVPGLVFVSLAYLLGLGVRRRREHALHDRDEAAEAAVFEERDRIARELHDIVAHSVSLMVVQAGAAERLIEVDADKARATLESIRLAGGEALDELRRMLGLLRDAPAASSAEPQPGLRRLDALLDQARSAGLDVRCTIGGTPRPLPVGVDLAAYRMVQEALTNVRKHSNGAPADVEIEFGGRALRLRVTNDSGANGHATAGQGHGLIGMRERVALYGGTLTHGPLAGGGFEVSAGFPLEPGPA